MRNILTEVMRDDKFTKLYYKYNSLNQILKCAVKYFMSYLVHKAQLKKDTFQGKVVYPILAILIVPTLDKCAFLMSHKLYTSGRWNTCS